MARKTVILRESLKHGAEYRYVRDDFLDAGSKLEVHVNHYDLADIMGFIESYGFDVRHVGRSTNRRQAGIRYWSRSSLGVFGGHASPLTEKILPFLASLELLRHAPLRPQQPG